MAKPPSLLLPSAFSAQLISWNALDAQGFSTWDFLPGMRFGERAAWWRGGDERANPHEGLDIRGFLTGDGRRLPLGAGARVPVLWGGEVVSIAPDFLGASVFVAHERQDSEGRRLHSVYGHVEPRPGLTGGTLLRDGDEVGTIADPAGRGTAVPPHLHLTVALMCGGIVPENLDWNTMRDRGWVLLLDPLPILCGTMPPRGDGVRTTT